MLKYIVKLSGVSYHNILTGRGVTSVLDRFLCYYIN
jgi:hypothetical protein